jgi:hypothetical protein
MNHLCGHKNGYCHGELVFFMSDPALGEKPAFRVLCSYHYGFIIENYPVQIEMSQEEYESMTIIEQ